MKTAQELITAFEDFVNKEISESEERMEKLNPNVDFDDLDLHEDRIAMLQGCLDKLKELNTLQAA